MHLQNCTKLMLSLINTPFFLLNLGNMPPTFIGPRLIQVKVNRTTKVQFTAKDPNNDKVSFALVPPIPDGASISSGLYFTTQNLCDFYVSYMNRIHYLCLFFTMLLSNSQSCYLSVIHFGILNTPFSAPTYY